MWEPINREGREVSLRKGVGERGRRRERATESEKIAEMAEKVGATERTEYLGALEFGVRCTGACDDLDSLGEGWELWGGRSEGRMKTFHAA